MPQTHPSEAIFRSVQVSKSKLTVDDALAVRRALANMDARITEIGRALGLSGDRVDTIKRLHGSVGGRCAIAIIDTWLRGDYNHDRDPYTASGVRDPTWWSLVWAVAHRVGGKNAAEARAIAEKHNTFHHSDPEPKFQNVDMTLFKSGEADTVAADLEEVWPYWYEIGVALKMATSTLDLLTGSPEEKMIAMITTWIEEGGGKDPPFPSWSQLVEAVAASYGSHNPALAERLAKKHPTGGEESMETEAPTTPSTQASQAVGGVDEDSARPHPITTFSDQQPDIPLAGASYIADDGTKLTLDQFVVYRRNKFSGGEKKPHGLALVIANEHFQGLPQRLCAKIDEQRLKETLLALGYRVVIRCDQTAEQMVAMFETISTSSGRDQSLHVREEDDSFVCVISSHGDWDGAKNTDVIYGRDGGTMDLKETAYQCLGTTVCARLKGKPKLFFVQACRGEQYGKIAADSGGAKRLPHESDFFISYSTAPMTKAFRYDPGKAQPEGKQVNLTGEQSYDKYNIGSFYITEVCLAFSNLAKKMDLMSMLLFVHQRLQAGDKMLFNVGSKVTRQCPHMSVSLRGPVFFFDKAEEMYREHTKQCLK